MFDRVDCQVLKRLSSQHHRKQQHIKITKHARRDRQQSVSRCAVSSRVNCFVRGGVRQVSIKRAICTNHRRTLLASRRTAITNTNITQARQAHTCASANVAAAQPAARELSFQYRPTSNRPNTASSLSRRRFLSHSRNRRGRPNSSRLKFNPKLKTTFSRRLRKRKNTVSSCCSPQWRIQDLIMADAGSNIFIGLSLRAALSNKNYQIII